MSDTNAGDVLMYFVEKANGTPIAAESRSALSGKGTTMMKGFEAGHYFEAEEFTFGIELADDEGGGSYEDLDQRSFSRWRALKDSRSVPNPPFRADPRDVTVTRQIDSSSPLLLKNCLDSVQFHQAVMVKRARVGSTGNLAGILRMEFGNVWIKAIDWADGDALRETCTFKFQTVQVSYLSRKTDGSVDRPWSCGWKGMA